MNTFITIPKSEYHDKPQRETAKRKFIVGQPQTLMGNSLRSLTFFSGRDIVETFLLAERSDHLAYSKDRPDRWALLEKMLRQSRINYEVINHEGTS